MSRIGSPINSAAADGLRQRPLATTAATTGALVSIGPNDVLLGRGSGVQYHPGNVAFRKHVASRKAEYLQCRNAILKAGIAQEIVNHVRSADWNGGDPLVRAPGRFLRQVGGRDTGLWEEADEGTVSEKVKQALRQQPKSKSKAAGGGDAAGDGEKAEQEDGTRLEGSSPNDDETRRQQLRPHPTRKAGGASRNGNAEPDRHPSAGGSPNASRKASAASPSSADEIESDLRQIRVGAAGAPDQVMLDAQCSLRANGAGTVDATNSSSGHIGYFDRLRLAQDAIRSNNSTGGPRLLLSSPSDETWLSPQLCLIRSQIEVFEATPEDVTARFRKGGTKQRIPVGQVGIRCIHCSHVPHNQRAKGAVLYPNSIRLVHQAVRNWQRYHLGKCSYIPAELGLRLEELKTSRSHSGAASLRYWVESCKRLGMVDAEPRGILLKRSSNGGGVGVGAMGTSAAATVRIRSDGEVNVRAMETSVAAAVGERDSIGGHPNDENLDGEAMVSVPVASASPSAGRVQAPSDEIGLPIVESSVCESSSFGAPHNALETHPAPIAPRESLDSGSLPPPPAASVSESSSAYAPSTEEAPHDALEMHHPAPAASRESLGGCPPPPASVSASVAFSRESSQSLEGEPPSDPRRHLLERVQLAYDIVRSTHDMHLLPSNPSPSGASDGNGQSAKTKEDLVSLGVGLYEWFAGCPPFAGNDGNNGNNNNESLCSDGQQPIAGTSVRATEEPRKKRGGAGGSENSKAYTPLKERGFPTSLSNLVSSLLGVAGDACYEAPGQVEEDLRLMIADPDRFLFDAGLEGMASGKLSIPRDRLYGREREISTLLDAYDRAIESDGESEAVMVAGYSGTGKSSLVRLVRGLLEDKDGFFISGKFDKLQPAQPYSPIVSALNEYCDVLLAREDAACVNRTRAAIEDAVGSDGKVLVDLIPKLEGIIGEQTTPAVAVEGKQAHLRLMFLFKVFVRAIASSSNPLILFLDDLQWADEASLELMASLVTDPGTSSLLLLGCYRDNEVGDDHPLAMQLSYIEHLGTKISSIKIGNIDRDSVNALVSDTLHLLPRVTLPLADIIFRKTGGNGLFVVQFLKALCDEGSLRFSLTSRAWEWDLDAIESKDVADNVAELMTCKMKKLSPNVQWILKLAACLGSRCEASTLNLLNVDDGSSLLDVVVGEGLMFEMDSSYKFSHDQIQQAAYSLIPMFERDALHLRIGRLLKKNVPDEELNDNVFTIVDQMRRGSHLISDHAEKVEVARLCLVAGEKAISSSTFLQASIYLLQGTALLDEGDWEQHYDLCLNLFSSCAEAQCVTGNYDGVTITSAPIWEHGRSFQDKLRACYTLLNTLGSQGKPHDAIDFGLKCLSQLGESCASLDPSAIDQNDIGHDFAKTRAMLEGTTIERILHMNEMEDKHKLAAMKILKHIAAFAFQVNQQVMSLITGRMVQLSLCYGLCRESSFSFAMFGITLCTCGELEQGYRYGKLASSIVDRFGATEYIARVYTVVYAIIAIFREPMQAVLPPLKHGYETGMKVGDNVGAFAACNFYVLHAIQSGYQLEPLEEEVRAYVQQMKTCKHQMLGVVLPYYQTILNLMGCSGDPTLLTGEAMDQDELLDMAIEKGLQHVASKVHFFRMWLAYFFRRYSVAAEMVKLQQDLSEARPFQLELMVNATFYTGLIAAAMVREGDEDKDEWRKSALDAAERMKTWTADSSWNCQHKLDLLNAEIARLGGDLDGAAKAYDDAIRVAGEHGFVHEQALACERAGIFFSEEASPARATACFERSHTLYARWGAKCKADEVLQLVAQGDK